MNVFGAVLTLVKNSGKVLQTLYNGKTLDKIQNLTPYGFFSNPPLGSKVVMIADTSNTYYGIAYLDEVIPSLEENEVAVGNFKIGSIVKFDKNGNINITCKKDTNINITGDCNINCTNANITAITKAKVVAPQVEITAPITNITSTTSITMTSPLTSLLSGGTGQVLITPAGTTIDGKPFLPHVHLAGTPPGNTGIVV